MMYKHKNNEKSVPFFMTPALQSIITLVWYVH